MSNNIQRRIQEHNSGQSKITKSFAPWVLLYSEECQSREDARKREKYWKSGIGREKRSKFVI